MIERNGLARNADGFILLSDSQVEQKMPVLAENDLATTPSGGAGLVAAMSGLVPLSEESRILVILSEEA